MIEVEAQRVNVIVYNKNLDFLVHKQPRQRNMFSSNKREYTLGLWADVEELHAHEHAIALVVGHLDREEVPTFLCQFPYVDHPDDSVYTQVDLYQICHDGDIELPHEAEPLWLPKSTLEDYFKKEKLLYDSQSAYLFYGNKSDRV